MHPKFQGPRWRTFRVCVFVGIGLSGFAPLIHGIKRFGFSEMLKHFGMAYYLGEGFLLILAALFYTVSQYLTQLLKLYDVANKDSFDFLNRWDLVNLI